MIEGVFGSVGPHVVDQIIVRGSVEAGQVLVQSECCLNKAYSTALFSRRCQRSSSKKIADPRLFYFSPFSLFYVFNLFNINLSRAIKLLINGGKQERETVEVGHTIVSSRSA